MKNPKLILNYLIFFIILGSFFYYKEIKDYKKETIGFIEDFEYDSRGSYTLT